MSSSMQQQQVEWRRAKILELTSKGETNQSEIARILQVDRSTVCRDVDYLRQQAKENIARYVDERLPEEYEKCLVGLNSILKEAWAISQTHSGMKSDKIKVLALAKECYAMKFELLTNATVVDDAIRFVASNAVKTTERVNPDKMVTTDEKVSNRKDTQWCEALAIFSWAFAGIEFTFDRVADGVPPLIDFLYDLYPPDVSIAPTLFESAIETIQMVLVGTVLGTLLAIPLSAMASSNIAPRPLVMVTRTYLMVVRTIPSLVWALIFVITVGLGPFSGVLALTFYTLGYLGKLYYEAIESIDMDTVEGVVAVGANNTQIFTHAILPQLVPHIVNNFFFMIDYNIRHAAILGLVGAGGIGFYLFLYLQSFNLDKVSMALLVLLILVIGFDRLSLEVRRKLIQ